MGVLLFILLLPSYLHVSFAWFLSDRFFYLPENKIIPGSIICAEIQILARFCLNVSNACAFLFCKVHIPKVIGNKIGKCMF